MTTVAIIQLPWSLGIAREDMPQIRWEDRHAFLAYLRAAGVSVIEGTSRRAVDLLPAQREINGAVLPLVSAEKLREPLIISADGYVCDGHHRWARMIADDATAVVPVVVVGLEARALIAMANAFPRVWHEGTALRAG